MSRKPTQHFPSTVGDIILGVGVATQHYPSTVGDIILGVGVATQRVLIGQQSLNVVSGHSIHTVLYTVVQCYFLCHAFFDV